MSAPLYNVDILRLAADIPYHRRLEGAEGTSEKRSATCGSRVIADARIGADGRIAAIGLEVRACALGQASASIMAAHAVGRSLDEIRDARDALTDYLAGRRPDAGDWPGVEVLMPARDYPARHASIRLGFEAMTDAAEQAAGLGQTDRARAG